MFESCALVRSNSSPDLFDTSRQPGRSGVLNFCALGGSDVGWFIKDADKQLFALRRLEQEFGYSVINGRRVVDISYPTLRKYVAKLRETRSDKIEAFAEIDRVDGLSGEALWQASLAYIMDVNPLPCGLKIRFHDSFLRMVENYTGEQRIKALITLQILINEEIGNLGGAFFARKKMGIVKSEIDKEAGYETAGHKIFFEFGKIEVPFLHRNAENCDTLLTSSSIWLHEFSHAYHYMLGLDVNTTNSAQAAYLADPFLRERLIPLLNPEVFNNVLTEVERSTDLYDDMITDNLETFRDNKFYRFLADNNFLGNAALEFPAELTSREEKIRARLISFVCFFMEGWDYAEEMLTIAGFTPLRLNGETDYLLLDRQNENVYTTRDLNKFRLTHRVNTFFKNSFRTKARDFQNILSQAMKPVPDLFIYPPGDRMGRSPVKSYAVVPGEIGTGISEDELNRCIENFLDDSAKDKDGRGAPDVRFFYNRLYLYVSDIVRYAVSHGLKLQMETVYRCLRQNAFTLSEAMIDQILQDQQGRRENVLVKLLKNARDCDQVNAILDYSLKNGIELFKHHKFIKFLDNKISGMFQWTPDTAERALILLYAVNNSENIQCLNDNFQQVIKYFSDNPGDHSVCIESLLKYASAKGLSLDVESLLDDSILKDKDDFIFIYKYAVAHNMPVRSFGEYIAKNYDNHWAVKDVLKKAKILNIPINVLELVERQISDRKEGWDGYLDYLNEADYLRPEQLLQREIRRNGPCAGILPEYYVNNNRRLRDESFILNALTGYLKNLNSDNAEKVRGLLDYCIANNLEITDAECLPQCLEDCFKYTYHSLCSPLLDYMERHKIAIPNFEEILKMSVEESFRVDQLLAYAHATGILDIQETSRKLGRYGIGSLVDFANEDDVPLDLTDYINDRTDAGEEIESALNLVGGKIVFNADMCPERAIAADNPDALNSIIKYFASIDRAVDVDVRHIIFERKTKCVIKYFSGHEDLPPYLVKQCIRRQTGSDRDPLPRDTNKFFEYASKKGVSIGIDLVKSYYSKVVEFYSWSPDREKLLAPCRDYALKMLGTELE
jgi:hypothetical protein